MPTGNRRHNDKLAATAEEYEFREDAVERAAHTVGMPVRLHHIVVDAHDLPRQARFWTQALGWKVPSQREDEIVIGTDENARVGMCFMSVTDPTLDAINHPN